MSLSRSLLAASTTLLSLVGCTQQQPATRGLDAGARSTRVAPRPLPVQRAADDVGSAVAVPRISPPPSVYDEANGPPALEPPVVPQGCTMRSVDSTCAFASMAREVGVAPFRDGRVAYSIEYRPLYDAGVATGPARARFWGRPADLARLQRFFAGASPVRCVGLVGSREGCQGHWLIGLPPGANARP